jgi:Tfp pilus assembly protein PilN
MKKPVAIKVNLVPRDPFMDTFLGKFLTWALSVGRYLVISTEMIVILSFMSRFTIDRQITDLNSSILQKKVVIQSYGDLEQNIRTIQKKIESFQQVEQQANVVDIFPALTQITPPDVQMKQLSMQPNSVTLSGNARSNVSLSLLISNLQNSPRFSDVVVISITTAQNSNQGFDFIIQANIRALQPTSSR